MTIAIGFGCSKKESERGASGESGKRTQEKSPAALSIDALPLAVTDTLEPNLSVHALIPGKSPVEQIHIQIDEAATLEFVPMILHPGEPAGVHWVVAIESDGDVSEVELESIPTIDPSRITTRRRLDALLSPAQIDLSSYAGKRIEVSWGTPERWDQSPRMIANVRLRPKEIPKRPNVLLICSDTHRFDYSTSKSSREMMPNLSALSARGVNYIEARSPSSWTLPSITSVLTGLWPRFHRTGEKRRRDDLSAAEAANYLPWEPKEPDRVMHTYRQAIHSMPNALQEAGYTTALLYANVFYRLAGLQADGFDFAFNLSLQDAATVNTAALEFLDAYLDENPLFMVVHYIDVHQWWDWNPEIGGEGPVEVYRHPRQKLIEAYGESVRDFDRQLGELIGAWEGKFADDESMIVFYSDHGEHLMDPGMPEASEVVVPKGHEEDLHYILLQYPILNHGNSVREELMHVPLVIKYPGGSGPEVGDETRPVSTIDIYPTIMDLIGEPIDLGESGGVSLLGIEDETENDVRVFYSSYQFYGNGKSSVRRGDLKWVLTTEGESDFAPKDVGEALFDLRLSRGVGGETDQRIDNPELAVELRKLFEQHLESAAEFNMELGSGVVAHDESAISDLKKLGYLR